MNYEPRKQVMLRIRRVYFDKIVSGEKTEELRKDSSRWAWLLGEDPPDVARFVCGKDTHLRKIERIYRGDVEIALGRRPSAQGIKDLGLVLPEATDLPGDREWKTEVIVIELGFVLAICPSCGDPMWRHFAREDGEPDDALDYFGCDNCEKIQGFFKVSQGGIPAQ